jgi:HlyD family type I secretion membrane fusion protein
MVRLISWLLQQFLLATEGSIMTSHFNPNSLPIVQTDEFLPPISRWTTWGGLGIMVIVGATIAFMSVAKYRVTVKGQATVRPVGELRLVQATAAGAVIQITAKENQAIKHGDVIATIDDSRLQTQKNQLQSNIQQAQLQLIQINAQIRALNSQIAAETERINRVVGSATAELNSRRRDYQDKQVTAVAEVEEAEANLAATAAALGAAQSKYNRYQSIADSGAISRDQLEETQLQVEQQKQLVEAAQARLNRARAALNPTDAEIAIAIERIAQEQASGQVNLATLAKEREALIQQRVEISQQLERHTHDWQQVEIDLNQTTITATADGMISKLNLRNPGQVVCTGEEIAQIVPSNTPLEVKATVSHQDRNKLEVGQTVQMRVYACPYPDYGVLQGRVNQISQDTLKPQRHISTATNLPDSSSHENAAIAFYEVTIEPSTLFLSRGKKQCSIQPGMEGRVDIISREETVLQFLLKKAKLIIDL